MSPKGRPDGEYRSAQREGDPVSAGPQRSPADTTVGTILSPCISVCVLDADGALCLGCFRTLDEIAAWSLLDADAKRGPAGEAAGPVPSPCISVCVLDAGGAYCLGCFRTLDEIAAWSLLDADAKRRVLTALPERRTAHRPR